MTVFPLSLIPTFAVPLYLILHILCIGQARQWNMHARFSIPFCAVPHLTISSGRTFDLALPSS